MKALAVALARAGELGHTMFSLDPSTPLEHRHRCADCGRILQKDGGGGFAGAALRIRCGGRMRRGKYQ